MSKRRFSGSTGNTPGKTAPKKSSDRTGKNQHEGLCFLQHHCYIRLADQKGGQEKSSQLWSSTWPCTGKGRTPMDGPASKRQVFGKIVRGQLLMPLVFQSIQVQPFLSSSTIYVYILDQFNFDQVFLLHVNIFG